MEVKCPKCRYRYDTPVASGENEVACVCPRCGVPFTFDVADGAADAQQSAAPNIPQKPTENTVPPIPATTETPPATTQESSTQSQGQAPQTPPPFIRTIPRQAPRNPFGLNPQRKDRGCLRNCLLAFIVTFVVAVFLVRNCSEERSYGSEILERNDSTEQVNPATSSAPHWLEGSWRVETDYGAVVVTIRGNQIVELLPDGQLNRGKFVYRGDKLYCDFGEENLLMMKINKKKRHILYGNQVMEKQ